MNLRLTTRDLQLFRWINAMGFVTIDHIARYWRVDPSTAHKRIKKLTDHHFLEQERLTCDHAIYYVRRRGVQACHSPLPLLQHISLATYKHNLLIVSVSLQLTQHDGSEFVSERELRHQQGINAFWSTHAC